MPRVNTSRANKDYPAQGIKKGDTYYHWQFYTGPVYRSKTPPRPSQLTGSEKYANALRIGEALEDALAAAESPVDVKVALDDAASSCQESIDEYEESISNLEEAFPGGCPNLDDANEKRDAIESYMGELESASQDVESLDFNDYELKEGVDPEAGGLDWDSLSDDGKDEMLTAAREIAEGVSCDI